MWASTRATGAFYSSRPFPRQLGSVALALVGEWRKGDREDRASASTLEQKLSLMPGHDGLPCRAAQVAIAMTAVWIYHPPRE